VPKAVYRSGCRDKHNRRRRDSNLDPLTPQSDALTTRPQSSGQSHENIAQFRLICRPAQFLPLHTIFSAISYALIGSVWAGVVNTAHYFWPVMLPTPHRKNQWRFHAVAAGGRGTQAPKSWLGPQIEPAPKLCLGIQI